MSKHILIVDDEAKLRRVIRDYLEQEGYSVAEAENGEQALYTSRNQRPDLILLDIMMPVMNGLEFLQRYRKEAETPIIFLTAKVEEQDEILGLEVGADDFVRKPFSMKALMARVRAVLRRADGATNQDQSITSGSLQLNPASREALFAGHPLSLTPTEFAILHTLMNSPERAFSRGELMEASSGEAFEAYERSIDVHIRNLRKKISVLEPEFANIETVFGLGYRFRRLAGDSK